VPYELLLFVHVACAIAWVGSVFAAQGIAWGLLRSKDVAGAIRFAQSADVLGKVLGPIVALLLIAGILLVEKIGIGYTTPWVVIGLSAYAASIAVGGVLASRANKRAETLVTEHGTDSPLVAAAVRRVWTLASIDLVILTVAVWAMTWKPGV
jgi:uncharacterized membrane protein SirB2